VVEVGPTGRFELSRRVTRLVTVDGQMALECATDRCELRATVQDPAGTVSPPPVTLHFDPEGPVPLLPTLTAGPVEDVGDGNGTVVVTGERFAPDARPFVFQCVLPETADGQKRCRLTGVQVRLDGGRFVVGVPVLRTFTAGGRQVDCDRDPCAIAVDGTIPLGPMIAPDPVPLVFAPPARR
jgi:hypothetical protein